MQEKYIIRSLRESRSQNEIVNVETVTIIWELQTVKIEWLRDKNVNVKSEFSEVRKVTEKTVNPLNTFEI